MKTRNVVSQEMICSMLAIVKSDLFEQMEIKGDGSFISPHETLGAITEEYWELVESIKSNDKLSVCHELADLAVACIFGMASIMQNDAIKR